MLKWDIKGDTIEIFTSDKLTDKDYEELLPVIDSVLDIYQNPKFLIVLDHFKGWEIPGIWVDLKYDLKSGRDFGPMAVIGDEDCRKWTPRLSNIFFPSELRYFSQSEEQKARSWLALQKEMQRFHRNNMRG